MSYFKIIAFQRQRVKLFDLIDRRERIVDNRKDRYEK
jgi:hypothetical protein